MKPFFSLIFFFLFTGLPDAFAQKAEVIADTALARQYLEEAEWFTDKRMVTEAREKVDSAKVIYEKMHEKGLRGMADVWAQTGIIDYYSGDYEKALQDWNKSLGILTKLFGEMTPEAATIMNNLGVIYLVRGDYSKAIKQYEKVLEFRINKFGVSSLPVAQSYENLGLAFSGIGEYVKSTEYLYKALDIQTSKSEINYHNVAQVYNNLGSVFDNLGKYNIAIDYYQKGLNTWMLNPGAEIDHPTVATFYTNLGLLHNNKGAINEAIEYLEKALDIQKKKLGANHPDLSITYLNLGIAYDNKGKSRKSIEYHYEALKIFSSTLGANHPYVASTYSSLGVIFGKIGFYEKAIEVSKKAIAIQIALLGESHLDVAKSYDNLGNIYYKKQDFSLALKYQLKALAICEEKKENNGLLPVIYNSLGNTYNGKGNYDEAIQYLNKAQRFIVKQMGENSPNLAIPYMNLVNVYYNKGNYQGALKYIDKALHSINYLNQDSISYLSSHSNLISLLHRQSICFIALFHREYYQPFLYEAKKSLEKNFKVLNDQFRVQSLFSQSSLIKTAHKIYEEGLLTNLLLYQKTDSTHYQTESFTFAERSKSLLLYQSIQESQALQYAGIPDSLLEQEYDLRVDISYYDQKRQEELTKGLTETDSTVLEISSTLFDLNQSYDSLKTLFETQYPDYYNLKYDLSTVSIEEVQQDLLAPDQTMLQYFVGDSSIFVFTLNTNSYDVLEVKKDFPLEEWVDQMRKGMYAQFGSNNPADSLYVNSTYSAEKYTEAAFQLYQKLVAPVTSQLKQRLIIVPDGVLGYVPFQALLTQAPNRAYRYQSHAYFGIEHPISYAYSATLWKEMRQKQHQQKATKSLLAVAPYYDGSLYTLDSLYQQELAELGIDGELQTRNAFAPLKYSGEEAFFASELWQGDYLDQGEATEARFIQSAGDYRILHLATHGEANDQVGEYAFLAFTEIPDSLENELLYVKDIYNLSLNADLVILSACQTGTGELQRGEGIISLARAFAYAGAKSMITTLWSVNDAKTKELMNNFHLNLKQGDTKDVALWKAQNQYLKSNKGAAANPFYWAPFIGIGDMGKIKS